MKFRLTNKPNRVFAKSTKWSTFHLREHLGGYYLIVARNLQEAESLMSDRLGFGYALHDNNRVVIYNEGGGGLSIYVSDIPSFCKINVPTIIARKEGINGSWLRV